VLTKKAWAFYSSAATNLVTRDANRSMFDRIWFRPRLLRNIRHIDTSTKILGHEVKLPFFVSPAAMAKLAHPDGELALAKGCEKFGISQCVRAALQELPKRRTGDLLINVDLDKRFLHNGRNHIERSARLSTILLPTLRQQGPGRFRSAASRRREERHQRCMVHDRWPCTRQARHVFRISCALILANFFVEGDERVKVESATYAQAAISGAAATNDSKGGGLGRTMGTYIDDSFNWDDIKWLRKSTKLPIVAKGVQTAEDAVLAMEHGLDGIVITNHGGRNLDTYANLSFACKEMH
jgi:L-lactate dehydrogenase (cytochrome)